MDILKYIFEALAIAVVSKVVIGRRGTIREVATLTAMIVAVMVILDTFAPSIGIYTRQGAGLGMGLTMVPVSVSGPTMGAGQTGGGYGGGLQAAMGLQRTLRGGGLQAAMGLQRTLRGVSQMGGTIEAMDDPVALDFYSHNFLLTGKTPQQNAVYDALIATDAAQVNFLDRALSGRTEEGFEGGEAASSSSSEPSQSTPSVPHKEAGVLYSGALIHIVNSNGARWSLPKNNKTLQVKSALLDDALFKFRVVLPKGTQRLAPINYGDTVHFVYTNDQLHTVTLNHHKNVNVLKSSDAKGFTIVSKVDATGPVHLGADVIIGTDDGSFLKASDDSLIPTTKDEATTFKIREQKGCGPLWLYTK